VDVINCDYYFLAVTYFFGNDLRVVDSAGVIIRPFLLKRRVAVITLLLVHNL